MHPLLPCTNRFSALQTDPQAAEPISPTILNVSPTTAIVQDFSPTTTIVSDRPKRQQCSALLPVSTLSLMSVDVLPLLTIAVQLTRPSSLPVTLTALVDCGACASFIDSAVVDRFSLPTTPLSVPQPIQMVDNSTAAKPVTHSSHIYISTSASAAHMDVFVTNIGRYDMILGLPWLRENNPRIDWSSCSILPPATTPIPLPLMMLPEPEWNENDFAADAFPDLPDPPNYVELLRTIVPTQYHDLLSAFSKTATDFLPPTRPCDHAITLTPEARPASANMYNLSEPKLNALRSWLDEHEAKGFIRKSSSPWGAPVLFAGKADGSLRPCMDYRALNAVTVKNTTPLPLIVETFDRLRHARLFTRLDLRGAFNLIRMHPDSIQATAFRTRWGLYECLVMPFGLTNAPATFQSFMNSILHEHLDVFCTGYLDDILIFSDDPTKHDEQVRTILAILVRNHLYVKAEKCEFSVTSTTFLGHVVTTQGFYMDPARASTILDWPEPTTVKEVQKFLGFANSYRRYIDDYASLALPMNRLTTIVSARLPFNFAPARSAFAKLKARFASTSLLSHFAPSLPTLVETDSSGYAISAILSQTHPTPSSSNKSEQRPVAFYSRKLTKSELNYGIRDAEMLAIVEAIRQWAIYLEACEAPFTVYTDHQTLQYFQTSRTLAKNHVRWSEDINHHKYHIKYRPARHNSKADFLSRRPDWELEASLNPRPIAPLLQPLCHSCQTLLPPNDPIHQLPAPLSHVTPPRPPMTPTTPNNAHRRNSNPQNPTESPPHPPKPTTPNDAQRSTPIPAPMTITTPSPDIIPLIRQCLPHDPTISPLIHLIRQPNLPRTAKQQRQLHHFSLNNNFIRHNGLIYIPENDNLRASLLHQAHDERSSGHHGVQKTLELIRRNYSWPGMTAYIENYISSCDICQHSKLPHRPPQGLLKPLPIPKRPWSSISWDHITELPPSIRSPSSKNPPYSAILVIVCRLTKLAHFIPTRTTDNATTLAQQFIDNVYRPHGLPSDIVSDRGATFSSAWWREVTRLLGTRTNLSTAFHPQSDGQTERTNQTIEHYIRAFGDHQQSDWSTLLPLAEFAYNNSFHSAIGMSPFFATYGYHPTATLNSATASIQLNSTTPSTIPNASKYTSTLTAIHKTASDLIAIAHKRYTTHANTHRRPHDPFAPGTLVMINRRNIKTTRPTVKFDDKLIGPFKVVRPVGSHAYRLDLGTRAIHPTFHVDLLHLYKPPNTIPARPTHTKPPAEIVDTNAFLVERILSSRIHRKRLQYLVRWEGYSSEDDSWVPHTEFHHDDSLVLEFHTAHPTLPTRRG